MTVTQRRARVDAAQPEDRPITEPGIKYTCDFCHVDITHTVRIKCAMKECEEVDLCPSCFCEGKEGLRHKAWHDYKVVEQHSQPIFTEDWGADEELLLVSGLITFGLGNWLEVAQHIGTRTKEDCEKHYFETYLGIKADGKDPMDMTFNVDPDEFQIRKKARIEELRKPHALPPPNAAPLVSAPTNHEVAGYMPGRLEFEHEVDNDAEMAVKDMEFGLVYKYGGDEQPEAVVTRPPDEEDEDEEDEDEEGEGEGEDGKEKKKSKVEGDASVKDEPQEEVAKAEEIGPEITENAVAGPSSSPSKQGRDNKTDKAKGKGKATAPPGADVEDEDELEVKLAMLDIYFSKLDKRLDAKEIIFDRGLTEHKKIQAMERKRPKEEKELIQRYKVFAKLQTAQDFEVLIEGLIYEQNLRKRIAELQEYRRMGITTCAEAEAYDNAKAARAGYRPIVQRDRPEIPITGGRVNAGQHRFLHGGFGTPPPGGPDPKSREATPRVVPAAATHVGAAAGGGRKPPAPLNLANAASLDLLSKEEQSLCSSLRVLPKPYLLIKEMYIRENERRHGYLKRRDARKMLKIDVNKSGRIFDFLVSSGMLQLSYDPTQRGMGPGKEGHVLMDGVMMNVDVDMSMSMGMGMDFDIGGGGLGKPVTHEIRLNGA
ncbi:transcriptional adapter 2-alpha [Kwoniella heveanensis CBS 569]|uniref:Transcriptional adapter 2-alpha n=1 Tax=Kwoniella heveanensis BCC8398 TaxID=1296120 RepID=A0A1B9GSS5_9TREE|nr:transcriptional adapter 2-alpha [Kwoniella heveanensis BCC8398]OCF40560.1 transcriptional adapter 2-alpha [Kwoniella heveanensis CBS 569]